MEESQIGNRAEKGYRQTHRSEKEAGSMNRKCNVPYSPSTHVAIDLSTEIHQNQDMSLGLTMIAPRPLTSDYMDLISNNACSRH